MQHLNPTDRMVADARRGIDTALTDAQAQRLGGASATPSLGARPTPAAAARPVGS